MTVPGFYDKDAEALLDGLIDSIRTIDNASVSILSRSPTYDRDRYDARITGINYKDLGNIDLFVHRLKYPQYILLALIYKASGKYLCSDRLVIENDSWKAMCDSDVIITGLDDSFTTIYGALPFYENFYNILLGKLLDKKVVLYGGSIGPFEGSKFEILGRYILARPDLITLGEDLSCEYMKKIGVQDQNIFVTANLTFPLIPASDKRIEEIMRKEGIDEEHKPIIGVSISRAFIKKAGHGSEENNLKFVKVIAETLDALVERTGATILFMPQVFGPCDYYDDRITSGYFRNVMRLKERAIILESHYTPEELRGLAGRCDFFIGSRTDAVINAAVMCVPFMALDHDSFQMRGIVGRMLDCENYIFSVKDIACDNLLRRIMDSWTQRDMIRKELGQKTTGLGERALRNTYLLQNVICRQETSGNSK